MSTYENATERPGPLGTLEAGGGAPPRPPTGLPRWHRRLRASTVGAVGLWTLLWLVVGVRGVVARTALGSGRYGESVDPHEVFELVFASAGYAARWIPGVAMILLLGLVTVRTLERRA